jgi:clan AA aspartic protease (TIGR02281 family)
MRALLTIPAAVRGVQLAGPEGETLVDLLLDSGAAMTAVSWACLESIGYDPAASRTRRRLLTANGLIEVPVVRVERVSVGELESPDIEVGALDVPGLTGVQGMLGLNFLQKFRTVLDYRQGYLEIE